MKVTLTIEDEGTTTSQTWDTEGQDEAGIALLCDRAVLSTRMAFLAAQVLAPARNARRDG